MKEFTFATIFLVCIQNICLYFLHIHFVHLFKYCVEHSCLFVWVERCESKTKGEIAVEWRVFLLVCTFSQYPFSFTKPNPPLYLLLLRSQWVKEQAPHLCAHEEIYTKIINEMEAWIFWRIYRFASHLVKVT